MANHPPDYFGGFLNDYLDQKKTMSDDSESPSTTEQKVPVADTPLDVSSAEELHAAKLEIVKLLNAKRAAAGVQPLEFDSLVSSAADKHCQEMVSNGTLSHWDSAGRKPYQRYFEGGSRDHIDERVGGDDAVEGASFETSTEKVLDMMTGLHEDFAKTGEASRALAPGHTHLGIGVALSETHFRYVEVYVARYVDIEPSSLEEIKNVNHILKGKVLSSLTSGRTGKWGPVACVVYQENAPSPMSVDDLATLDAYEDFSDSRAAVTWPWEMTFNADDGTFEVPISFDSLMTGSQYYVMLYVREDPDTIPYSEMAEGLAIPGEGFVESTGIMLTYSGPDVRRENEGVGDGGGGEDGEGGHVTTGMDSNYEMPVVDMRVVAGDSGAEETEQLLSEGWELTKTAGNPSGSVSGEASGVQILILKKRDPSLRPITRCVLFVVVVVVVVIALLLFDSFCLKEYARGCFVLTGFSSLSLCSFFLFVLFLFFSFLV